MTKEKQFLELFNKLEKYLRIEYNQNKFSYTGFMSSIYSIKKTNRNSVIANKNNFDILKQASQIRNIISHNNDVIVPSETFLSQFTSIVDKICNPLKVGHIMIPFSKLKTVKLSNKVSDAINLIKEYGYNSIPVLEDNELQGIFTEKSLFDFLSINKNISISKDMNIEDILEAIDLNSDPRKYFAFVSRNLSVEEAYEHFDKDLKHRREMLLLLVTEGGQSGEKLLGIVALRDIENALLS